MRKMVLTVILFTFFLNACGIADRIDTHTSMERKDMVETIVDAIFENDADTICSLFAPNVQEANDDLKSDVEEFKLF